MIDYASLSDAEMVSIALTAGIDHFNQLLTQDLLNGDGFHLRLGRRDPAFAPEFWRQLGERAVNQATWDRPYDQYSASKARTVAAFGTDSDDAGEQFGHLLPFIRGNVTALGWTGGVIVTARADLSAVGLDTKTLEIIAAGSGVQGAFDREVCSVAANRYAALWVCHHKAQAGLL